MRLFVLLMFLRMLLLAAPAQAQTPLTNFNVVLLQPSAVLEARVPQVDAMAAYVKAVEVAAREAVLASGVRQAVGGFIVVAVRPDRRTKVWLDFDGLVDLALKSQLVTKVEAVESFEVVKGPVVFALKVATWNGRESKRLAPSPPEWRSAAASGARLEVGELVERLWGD